MFLMGLPPTWACMKFSAISPCEHFIFRGHTSLRHCWMWFPLCNKTTPYTTASLPFTWWITLSFIHSHLFFCSPTTRMISPISGICCFPWFTLWLSIRLLMYFLCQWPYACFLSLFSRPCSLKTSFSSISMSSNSCAFFPHMILCGINVCVALLCCSWLTLTVDGCWGASKCQWWQLLQSGVRGPRVL